MPADETVNGSANIEEPDNPEDLDRIEPGADGPVGQGVEGADTILEEDRPHDEEDGLDRYGDLEDAQGFDESAAAEQGNRDEDEMVSEGDDAEEVAELGGDDQDVDAIAAGDEPLDEERLAQGLDIDGDAAGLAGDVEGEDPLAGGPVGS